MRSWSFYSRVDGTFTGREFSSSDVTSLQYNIPDGCAPIEGVFDFLSQKVDLSTGQVIDYQPPQPDADHEWNVTTRRWHKRSDVLEREARRRDAQARIDELELKQLRRVRELLAESDPQLKAIDDEIAELRQALK